MVGPFYFVYLKPRWHIMSVPAPTEAETIGHPQFWRQIVIETLAPTYAIKATATVNRLVELCYGMPRGRCTRLIGRRLSECGPCALFHGGDWPKRLNRQAQVESLAWHFSVLNELVAGGLRLIFDDHETMQASDQHRLQELIGPIPY